MADTTFTNNVTLTDADWFNDLNRLHYTIFGDPATAVAAKDNLVPVKIITATRAADGASGDVAYTGVGFKPRSVIVLAAINASRYMSIGMFTATSNVALYDVQSVAGGYGVVATQCVTIDETTGSKSQTAAINTMDSDGFTLTWTRTGVTAAGTISLYFLCFA